MSHDPAQVIDETNDINTGALVKSGLLAALGIMVWVKFLDGSLNYYVHPRYNGLIAGTGAIMTLIGLIGVMLALGKQPHKTSSEHKATGALTYALLLIPLVFGLLIPARPLGVNAIQDSGTRAVAGTSNLSASSVGRLGGANQNGQASDTSQWTLLEWSFALNEDPTLASYKGKPVDLVGFVYRPKNGAMKGGAQYYIARYIVICCTADSTGVSLPVVVNNATNGGAGSPTNDSWVQVRGRITQVAGPDGVLIAAIAADSQQSVKQPGDPYLYP